MATISIELQPETERTLRDRAGKHGTSIEGYLAELAEREVASLPMRRKSFDEVVAPISQAVEASGLSDDEVGKLFDEELADVRRERRERRRAQS